MALFFIKVLCTDFKSNITRRLFKKQTHDCKKLVLFWGSEKSEIDCTDGHTTLNILKAIEFEMGKPYGM